MVRMPSQPQIHEPRARPGSLLHAAGLALMVANKVRRTSRHDRPRPWSARDVDRSVDSSDLPDDEIGVHSFRLVLRKRPGWETS